MLFFAFVCLLVVGLASGVVKKNHKDGSVILDFGVSLTGDATLDDSASGKADSEHIISLSDGVILPSSGFVKGKLNNANITLRISHRIRKPPICRKIILEGTSTDSRSSPLMGPPEFEIMTGPDDIFNDHHAWTNGKEVLSYATTGDFGTWIIGSDPGHDSGFGYLKPSISSMTPCHLESSKTKWHWLIKGKWIAMNDVKAVCADKDSTLSSYHLLKGYSTKDDPAGSNSMEGKRNAALNNFFFRVEYFDPHTNDAVDTMFLTGNHISSSSSPPSSSSSPSHPSRSSFGFLWDRQGLKWTLINDLSIIAPFASPVLLSSTSSSSSNNDGVNLKGGGALTVTAHATTQEHAAAPGWRVLFKYQEITPTTTTTNHNNNKDKKQTKQTKKTQQTQAKKWESDITVEISSSGRVNGFEIIPELPSLEKQSYNQLLMNQLLGASVGEWIWVWHTSDSADFDEATEVLLQCLDRSDDIVLFRYFPADRQEQMTQTVLSRETQYFVVKREKDGDKGTKGFTKEKTISRTDGGGADGGGADGVGGEGIFLHDQNGNKVNVEASFFIGTDIVGYIRNYLDEKEGEYGGMSSCYFYHAAVSLPRALVYAGEIICVMIGAKPLTMIQFTSSSDEQWKFPLVTELSRKIISAKTLLGNKLDIEYRVHKYREAETLIIYRSGRAYLVDSLVPYGESQALHPMPYPDADNPEPDWKLQIYNSWWNGYVLGYPERFVDSYCATFHNGLGTEDRDIQVANAKKDVKAYFASIGKQPTTIVKGLDTEIDQSIWNV